MNADLKDACLFPATAQSVKNPTQDFGAAKRTTWCSSFRHIPIQEWTLHVPRCAFLLTDSWLNRQRNGTNMSQVVMRTPQDSHFVGCAGDNSRTANFCTYTSCGSAATAPDGRHHRYKRPLALGTGQGNQKRGPDSALSLLMLLGLIN